MLLVRIDVWTYWRTNVLMYERIDVWTYWRMNIWTYGCTHVWTDDWMNLWAEGCQALWMNDRKYCRLNVLQICHSYDCPSDLPSDRLLHGYLRIKTVGLRLINAHPTEISVGFDKNLMKGRVIVPKNSYYTYYYTINLWTTPILHHDGCRYTFNPSILIDTIICF